MINKKILRIFANRFVLIYGDLFYFLFKTPLSRFFHYSVSRTLSQPSLDKKSAFLISSERGLYFFDFHLGRIVAIVRGYIFGFAVTPRHAFIAISSSQESSVYSFDLKNRFRRPTLIYKQHARYHGERIHQLDTFNSYIFMADTFLNAITVAHVDSPEERLFSVHPYISVFNSFVNRNVNHINSIQVFSNAILFIAHNGGSDDSHIGLIFEDQVSIYVYRNRGCHDIVCDNEDLLISDSFGSFERGREEPPGIVTPEGKIPLDTHFARGILKMGNNIFSCSSFHGKRDQRFTGSSQLFKINRQTCSAHIVQRFNFSQIHNISFFDGSKFDAETSQFLDVIKVQQLLCSIFSDPISTHKYIVTVGGTKSRSIHNIFDYTSAFND